MMKLSKTLPVLVTLASSACVPTETSAPETSGNRNGGAEISSTSKFLKPKQCMMLFGQSASISGALQIAQGVQNEVKWYGDIVGVYKLANGQYGAVRDYLLEDTIKSTTEGEKSIARQVGFGDYPPSTRCTDGSDLSEYTGQRSMGTKHEGKDLSIAGLVVTGMVKGAQALQDAANAPSNGGNTPMVATEPETQKQTEQQGVTVSKGIVRENGREIGRVEVQWGYNIICANGYNYGSDSVFGGSFKADVDSMDEAVAVVLSACKR